MKTLITCSIASVLLCVAACEDPSRVLLPGRTPAPDTWDEVIMLDDPIPPHLSDDPGGIEDVCIAGDLLKLKVAYSGGCRTHEFKLFGSTGFLESYRSSPGPAFAGGSHDQPWAESQATVARSESRGDSDGHLEHRAHNRRQLCLLQAP